MQKRHTHTHTTPTHPRPLFRESKSDQGIFRSGRSGARLRHLSGRWACRALGYFGGCTCDASAVRSAGRISMWGPFFLLLLLLFILWIIDATHTDRHSGLAMVGWSQVGNAAQQAAHDVVGSFARLASPGRARFLSSRVLVGLLVR